MAIYFGDDGDDGGVLVEWSVGGAAVAGKLYLVTDYMNFPLVQKTVITFSMAC